VPVTNAKLHADARSLGLQGFHHSFQKMPKRVSFKNVIVKVCVTVCAEQLWLDQERYQTSNRIRGSAWAKQILNPMRLSLMLHHRFEDFICLAVSKFLTQFTLEVTRRHGEVQELRCCIENAPLHDCERSPIIA
jgi:hypothetical protein